MHPEKSLPRYASPNTPMKPRIPRIILYLDIVWLLLALGVSYTLRYDALMPYTASFYRVLAPASVAFWLALFHIAQLDGLSGGWRLHAVLGKVAVGTGGLMLFILAFAYLARLYYSRLMLFYFAGLLFVGFFMARVTIYVFLRWQHRRGRTRKAVLLGNQRFIQEFVSKIHKHPELLYEMAGTLHTARGGEAGNGAGHESEQVGLSSDEVLSALANRKIQEVIVLLDESPGLEFQAFISRCRAQGLAVSVLPRGYELYTSKPRLLEIDGFPLVSLEQRSVGPAAARFKRAIDLVFAALLMPLAACIVGCSAIVLLMKNRRVFRRELRIGMNGRPFWMYRLDVPGGKSDRPAYERSLLRLSISEIPQIWNVLKGEMTLVGPRPESPGRVKSYSEWQQQRLKAKPGMTGLAQVNGLRDQHASEDKTRYDLQYMLEWTPFTDIVLLFRTLGALIKRCLPTYVAAEGSTPRRSTQPSPVVLSEHNGLGGVIHVDRA